MIGGRHRTVQLVAAAPDVLDGADQYQLVTHEIDEDGAPKNVRLHPDVEYGNQALRGGSRRRSAHTRRAMVRNLKGTRARLRV
jgi:hypothetical protein